MPDSKSSTTERALPPSFASVFALLKTHMARLDVYLREQLAAFEPEIRDLADYCIDTSGKRIRPSLVFLGGWTGDADAERGPSAELVRVAAVVELVHLATLVHDDIMDGALVRRNRSTAAREYGPEASVLLGDALFSHALKLSTQFPTTEVCAAVADSMKKVCAGEIVQTLRRGSANISHADYRRIIDLKTAELFRLSCFLGARLAGGAPEFVAAAAEFGRRLGVAYQIYDDLADFFGDEHRIGKTLGTDLASGKITLPLLVLLDRLSAGGANGAGGRSELLAEILHEREPQPALRLRQMAELGVFPAVADAVEDELRAAEQELAPHADQSAAALLGRLCEVLRGQVGGLRPAEAS
ncbi:polyprenyl synthetase family protein [Termitidicoccus mucosus]|uniref:Polyprenyl synthetase n=1 Tax=Termitidicoccus mucosus TaxID=1184151 RepID=A0A178IEF3_9BACT|nr:polyprenyl synthetase [Opitutaceae bacterium TSB47]